MKTKILSGLICCLGIFSANAQTITAPVGQSLTVTNPIDITVAGGSINVPTDGSFKVGGFNFLKSKSDNVLLGLSSGYSLTTGVSNLFLGGQTGLYTTTGGYNSFFGTNAGLTNTDGSFNTFIGSNSGYSNTSGIANLFLGFSAGYTNNLGNYNMFFGSNSGYANTNGSNNLFLGASSGNNNTSGSRNVIIGVNGGSSNTTGTDNTYIGNASNGSALLTFATAIGANASVTTSNTVVLGKTDATVVIGGTGISGTPAKLEITSGITDKSGLKFVNLTSASAPGSGGSGKVLSVDSFGNVILVSLTGATVSSVGGPVAENWKESDGYLYNNSTTGVVIKGTGLDGNALIVKGGVLSKEVNVKVEGSEAWPDYVFKPNYKRMTLGEVEKFIAINGHLPNVPSATEMVANGNNLGKTDVKLLEKVEELTLYLLEMKKANDAQAAELKSLKQQVSKLRKK
jgi:hypothetical protein